MPVTIRTWSRQRALDLRLRTARERRYRPPGALGAPERAGRPDAVPRGRGAAAHHGSGAARRHAGGGLRRPPGRGGGRRPGLRHRPETSDRECRPSWSPPPSTRASPWSRCRGRTPFIAISRFVAAAVAADEYAAVARVGGDAAGARPGRAGARERPATVLERLVREVGGWALLVDAAGTLRGGGAAGRRVPGGGAAAGAGPPACRARPRERGAHAAGGDGPRAVAGRRPAHPRLPRGGPRGHDPGRRAARRQHRRPRADPAARAVPPLGQRDGRAAGGAAAAPAGGAGRRGRGRGRGARGDGCRPSRSPWSWSSGRPAGAPPRSTSSPTSRREPSAFFAAELDDALVLLLPADGAGGRPAAGAGRPGAGGGARHGRPAGLAAAGRGRPAGPRGRRVRPGPRAPA